MHVLMVDDDEQLCRVVSKHARAITIDYDTTTEGAVLRLERREYDLVLLDAVMKEGRPIDVLRKAQDLGIRVIVFTGYGDDHEAVRELVFEGADDVIKKPFDVEEIERAINGQE